MCILYMYMHKHMYMYMYQGPGLGELRGADGYYSLAALRSRLPLSLRSLSPARGGEV